MHTTIVADSAPKKPSEQRYFIKFVKENAILLSILVSILVGFGIGIALKHSSWNNTENVLWFTLPGSLFIRSLELLVVPVVFIGVVAATSSLSAQSNLRITLICAGLTLFTHLCACLTALGGSLVLDALFELVKTPSPPSGESLSLDEDYSSKQQPQPPPHKQKAFYDIIADILRSIIPKNIIKAATNQEITRYIVNSGTSTVFKRNIEYIEGTNVLGILMFALLIGLAASVLSSRVAIFKSFFKEANDIIILILRWFILFAPIGIASLIVDAILEVQDLVESFKAIGLFAGVVVLTLLFYCIVELGIMLFIVKRGNPFRFFYYFLEPALLAFASTSGAVCIHKSLDVCENKVKMDLRIPRFGIPFYTALQSDGSAIFIAMSCIFLAGNGNETLKPGDYLTIVLLTCILCTCLPSVPSSSIVAIIVVLNALNLSHLNVAILYTVEWLLDRVRTTVNVYSHCFCTVITHELCKNKDLNVAEDLIRYDVENKEAFDTSSHQVLNLTDQTAF